MKIRGGPFGHGRATSCSGIGAENISDVHCRPLRWLECSQMDMGVMGVRPDIMPTRSVKLRRRTCSGVA